MRARQRGFVTVGEIQQELEDLKAPVEAFDQVSDRLRARDARIVEDSEDVLDIRVVEDDQMAVSDPVRMYLREIGRVALLTPQQEVELAMLLEAGRRAQEQLDVENVSLSAEDRAILERDRRRGDSAQQRLVEANLRLVVSIAKRYVGRLSRIHI